MSLEWRLPELRTAYISAASDAATTAPTMHEEVGWRSHRVTFYVHAKLRPGSSIQSIDELGGEPRRMIQRQQLVKRQRQHPHLLSAHRSKQHPNISTLMSLHWTSPAKCPSVLSCTPMPPSLEGVQAGSTPSRFVSVSASDNHACGLRDDGSVACWGNNQYGKAWPPRERFSSPK